MITSTTFSTASPGRERPLQVSEPVCRDIGHRGDVDQKPRVLIVDDQWDNILVLEDLLSPNYRVHAETDGQGALEFLQGDGHADLILLDVVMPGLDGFDTCKRIKANPRLQQTPVLFLTGLRSAEDEWRGLQLGAVDFIQKPFSPPVVLARVCNHLKLSHAAHRLRERNVELERRVEERTREVVERTRDLIARERQFAAAQEAILAAFCALAEARDNETGNHILRTQHYVRALAVELRDHPRFRDHLDDSNIDLLFRSAPLHDVGKVAIPDAILLKPGPLSDAEWEVMRQHTEHGRAAIARAEAALEQGEGAFLRFAREIAHAHHEWWDGSGYPLGLVGEAIPLSARLMALADVYDALISRRVYKEPFGHDRAVEIITAKRGTQFDPDILDAFVAIAHQFQDIARNFEDRD